MSELGSARGRQRVNITRRRARKAAALEHVDETMQERKEQRIEDGRNFDRFWGISL